MFGNSTSARELTSQLRGPDLGMLRFHKMPRPHSHASPQPPGPRNRIVGEVQQVASNCAASPQDVSNAAMKWYQEVVLPGPRRWKKLATQLFKTASTTSQSHHQGGTPSLRRLLELVK